MPYQVSDARSPEKTPGSSIHKVIQIPESFDTWAGLIDQTDLTYIQKHAIKTRVLSVVMRLRSRLRRLSVAFTCLRTTTTVGSLLVPSILTLQSPAQPITTPENGFSAYWAIWGIGLIVSISNAFVSLFRVDKNYYTIGNLIEKIESEAWLFLTQSGPYSPNGDEEEGRNSILPDNTTATGHRDTFNFFIEKCEILFNKAIRSEYATGFKQNGAHTTGASSTAGIGTGHNRRELLREAPSEMVEALYGKGGYTNPRDTMPPQIVPNPVDDTGRPSTGEPSSPRGGHPIRGVHRPDVQYHETASDSTEEDSARGNG